MNRLHITTQKRLLVCQIKSHKYPLQVSSRRQNRCWHYAGKSRLNSTLKAKKKTTINDMIQYKNGCNNQEACRRHLRLVVVNVSQIRLSCLKCFVSLFLQGIQLLNKCGQTTQQLGLSCAVFESFMACCVSIVTHLSKGSNLEIRRSSSSSSVVVSAYA